MRSKDELLSSLSALIPESADVDEIDKITSDINELYTVGETVENKWKNKFRERFFGGKNTEPENPNPKDQDADPEKERSEKITIDTLFEDK